MPLLPHSLSYRPQRNFITSDPDLTSTHVFFVVDTAFHLLDYWMVISTC